MNNLPNLPSTVISCTFLEREGSAITFTFVRSKPIPARLIVAATFTFAGKALTASEAGPSKSRVSFSIFSSSIPRASMCGAPARFRGGFRVVRVTEEISEAEAEFIPSIPTIAPEGKYSLQLFCSASLKSFSRVLHPQAHLH